MKLKFELKRNQIEYLYSKSFEYNFIEILQLVNQIWGGSGQEKIYFYFDQDSMIIYPEDKGGFDRVYARIHIRNAPSSAEGAGGGL